MSKIKCKYKFKNAEKFNGKAYCTCHNELCEDIAFCCDNNCQIYEDYKQLHAKEQECKKYKRTLKKIEKIASKHHISIDDYIKIRHKWVYAFSKGYATARWQLINPIQNIIDESKEK